MKKAVTDSICNETSYYCWYGTFAPQDNHEYLGFNFDVPRGTTKIRAILRYSCETGSILGLYLYDFRGFRAYGRTENTSCMVEITAEVAADILLPGAIAGPLPADRWLAEITTNQVKGICAYQLEIEIWQSTEQIKTQFPAVVPPKPEMSERKSAGWYRGDFHVHSQESDGTRSVKELLGIAREKGLDFLAITDHNGISNWWKIPAQVKEVLPIRGMEITTFLGHANALGIDDYVEWRTGKSDYSINDVADAVHVQGGLFSVNHPHTVGLLDGHADWQHGDLDWDRVDAIEVWNSPVTWWGEQANLKCRELWDQLLNQGYRITGIGGSDAHYFPQSPQPLGLPLNYVYAAELSQAGIIEAVKAGKVFVTLGPEVFMNGINVGGYALPGDRLPAHGGPITLKAEINCCGWEKLIIRVVKRGKVLDELPLEQQVFHYHCQDDCRPRDWYRLELHCKTEKESSLVAFTNPIYIY